MPGWLFVTRTAVGALTALAVASTLAFALWWRPCRYSFARDRGISPLSRRAFPLLAALAAAGFAVLAPAPAGSFNLEQLGHAGPVSLGLFACSLALPLFAAAGLMQAIRLRRVPGSRVLWRRAFATSLLLALASTYLGYSGVLGWCTWA